MFEIIDNYIRIIPALESDVSFSQVLILTIILHCLHLRELYLVYTCQRLCFASSVLCVVFARDLNLSLFRNTQLLALLFVLMLVTASNLPLKLPTSRTKRHTQREQKYVYLFFALLPLLFTEIIFLFRVLYVHIEYVICN